MTSSTASSGDDAPRRAASSSRSSWMRSSWSGNAAASFVAKCRKNVRGETPASAAISSTVVPSGPRAANSRIAAAASA